MARWPSRRLAAAFYGWSRDRAVMWSMVSSTSFPEPGVGHPKSCETLVAGPTIDLGRTNCREYGLGIRDGHVDGSRPGTVVAVCWKRRQSPASSEWAAPE